MSFENVKFICVHKFDFDHNNELNKISKSNKVQTINYLELKYKIKLLTKATYVKMDIHFIAKYIAYPDIDSALQCFMLKRITWTFKVM
jgi:hypothetical protein